MRQGPSLFFAVAVIGGVTMLTAGGVAAFFVEPSESAPEPAAALTDETQAPAGETAILIGDKPILTASLDPTFPPVRKVTTKSFPALKQGAVGRTSEPATPRDEPVEVASAAEVDALEQQDPRWAVHGDKADATLASVLPPAEEGTVETGGAVPLDDRAASDTDDPTDATSTAAIAPDEAKPDRKAKRDEAVADDTPSAAATRSVRVNRGVNMRSRPKSGSGVLTVIPSSAVVQLVGCKAWCEVIYKGRRGYVYKDYIGGSRRAATNKTKASSKKTAKKPTTEAPKTVYVLDQPKVATPVEEPRVKFTSQRLQ